MTTSESHTQFPPNSSGNRIQNKKWWDGFVDIFTPTTIIVDKDDPTLGQKVDNQGAAAVRFADGSPDFDIFGRLTTSELNLVGVYKFYENSYTDEFMKWETGAGVVSHDVTNRGMKLHCGTASGDYAAYKTHRHYIYRPLNDMPLHWTMKMDAGEVGRTRDIGWYTKDSRIVVEQRDGAVNFVVHDGLSNITTRVPQASWSHDVLDGSGGVDNRSGATLDVSKGSIWWISMQYLSMGIVQFGQVIDGVRVLLHQVDHYNELLRPYMEGASMSFGFTQTNTNIVGSDGDFHVYCVTVTNDGYDDFIHSQPVVEGYKTLTSDTWVPVVSYRPSQLTSSGLDNRSRVLPRMISVLATNEHIEIRTDINPALTGDTWTNTAKSVDFDNAATAITVDDDMRLFGRFVGAGLHDNTVLDSIIDVSKNGITRRHDITQSDLATVSARLLPGKVAPTDVAIVMTLWAVE